MDNNTIGETIYNTLDTRTAEIAEVMKECDVLEKKISSGRYTPQVIKEELYPKRDELNRRIQAASEAALQEAKGLLKQFKEDSEALNRLNPDDLTDDIKLLQPGIILNQSDIQAILDRNATNRTMTQIALRYAEEHGIDMKTHYTGGRAERETAQNLEIILDYYTKWIDQPNAKDMLDKFFGKKAVRTF